MVFVAERVVQRPQHVEIADGDRFESATLLEYVQAGFCIGKLLLHAIELAFQKLARRSEEKHNAGGKSPVAASEYQHRRTTSARKVMLT